MTSDEVTRGGGGGERGLGAQNCVTRTALSALSLYNMRREYKFFSLELKCYRIEGISGCSPFIFILSQKVVVVGALSMFYFNGWCWPIFRRVSPVP